VTGETMLVTHKTKGVHKAIARNGQIVMFFVRCWET